MIVLGVDIGGSGIKGAPVDIDSGELLEERFRIETPGGAEPHEIAKTVKELVDHFNWRGLVGFGFPAVVQNGIVRTASNISKSWIGLNAENLFSEYTGLQCKVVNDADAAGMAEMGASPELTKKGVVILITVGTGLGTAVFTNGQLLPNTELGHILLGDTVAEAFAADSVRKKEDLSWKKWTERFNVYLQRLEFLFWPDLFIIGGGTSKKFHKLEEYLKCQTAVQPANLLNNAGIVGAAFYAASKRK